MTLLGQVGAVLAGTDVEDGMAKLEGTIATSAVQQVQRALPGLTEGVAAMESAFDHYAPLATPKERQRIGLNPFNRAEYLVKLRR